MCEDKETSGSQVAGSGLGLTRWLYNGFAAQRRSPLKGFRPEYQRSAPSGTHSVSAPPENVRLQRLVIRRGSARTLPIPSERRLFEPSETSHWAPGSGRHRDRIGIRRLVSANRNSAKHRDSAAAMRQARAISSRQGENGNSRSTRREGEARTRPRFSKAYGRLPFGKQGSRALPYNGFAAQRRSPPKGFRPGYQRSAPGRTAADLNSARDRPSAAAGYTAAQKIQPWGG